MGDNKTGTKRAMGLFIVIIMFFSIAGSALYYVGTSSQTQEPNRPKIEINQTTNGELPTEQKKAVIGSGRVLFEYFYPDTCIECINTKNLLKQFSTQFENNLIYLEFISGKNQSLQMINQRGSIKDIGTKNITADSLLGFLCDNSLVQPRECLLLQFNKPTTTVEVNKSEETSQPQNVTSNTTTKNQTNSSA